MSTWAINGLLWAGVLMLLYPLNSKQLEDSMNDSGRAETRRKVPERIVILALHLSAPLLATCVISYV